MSCVVFLYYNPLPSLNTWARHSWIFPFFFPLFNGSGDWTWQALWIGEFQVDRLFVHQHSGLEHGKAPLGPLLAFFFSTYQIHSFIHCWKNREVRQLGEAWRSSDPFKILPSRNLCIGHECLSNPSLQKFGIDHQNRLRNRNTRDIV